MTVSGINPFSSYLPTDFVISSTCIPPDATPGGGGGGGNGNPG